jgi:light-harvesting complex 1 alpha chain
MTPRSPVRTNIIIFTILGFVVALLIHFIVLSSEKYNWLQEAGAAGAVLLPYLSMLLG